MRTDTATPKNVETCECIMGRTPPRGVCKSCEMRPKGPNNVGRAVQTDPTLLCYASAITEQRKCWELLAQNFYRFQTLRKNSRPNNTQKHATTRDRVCKRTQHVTSNNVGSLWPTMLLRNYNCSTAPVPWCPYGS